MGPSLWCVAASALLRLRSLNCFESTDRELIILGEYLVWGNMTVRDVYWAPRGSWAVQYYGSRQVLPSRAPAPNQ
jgi:hypothetical protein